MPKAVSGLSTASLSKSNSGAILKKNQVILVGASAFLYSKGYWRLVINAEDGNW